MAMKTTKAVPVLSFFCGAGGLDLGFDRAGFDVALAVDNDRAAVKSYNSNFENPVAVEGDISSMTSQWVVEKLKTIVPRGVIGGPPCQGFSKGNVTKNKRDPRNRLPFEYARLLRELNEKFDLDFFVFENVTGLLSSKNRWRLVRIKQAFQRAGFKVFEWKAEAAEFGLAQYRQRLFIVGINAKRWSEESFVPPRGNQETKTVRHVLGGLPEPVFFDRKLRIQDIPFHPNHWTMQPRSSRFATKKFNKWRSFRQLSWDVPSPTVAYGNREIHIHPTGERRLSVYEAMLLQGFPHNYELHGNFSQQITQVCNAVPPPLAQKLAEVIKSNFVRDQK